MPVGHQVYERYDGEDEQAELQGFEELARELMLVQERNRGASGAATVDRAFHAKTVLAVEDACLRVRRDLPQDLQRGCFRPGAELPVTVRFSNANGAAQPDSAPDLRGVALRVHAGGDAVHDLLMTNWPVSPAANAREFVAMASAVAGRTSRVSKLLSLALRLPRRVGPFATVRIIGNLLCSTRRSESLARERYYSRGAILWGEAGPVRYRLHPVVSPAVPPSTGPDALRTDFARRLAAGDVEFDLQVQRYVSERRTPVENTARRWLFVRYESVARLVLPRQDVGTARARLVEHRVDRLAFNPWNTTDEFRPLGNLNRARRAAYEAGSAHRLHQRFVTEEPRRTVLLNGLVGRVFARVNRRWPWHRLPSRLALLNLAVLRRQLRRENLIDTDLPARVEVRTPGAEPPADAVAHRTADGCWNDLSSPGMGATGARFGRNMPVDSRQSDLPDPVEVADQLLARKSFIPAPSLNVLAAAWIQFQVHDWVQHRRHPVGERSIDLPLPGERRWRNTTDGRPERVMRIAEDDGDRNQVSHWWDGSEVYGSDPDKAAQLREDGGRGARLRLEDGHLPTGPGEVVLAGFSDSWWLGLSALQTLFAREHNAVCDALQEEYPHLDDERTYQTARLVVSALIAKIHTVEWTPAILGTKTLDTAMSVNWRGAPDQWLTRLGLRLLDPHAVHGIPRTRPDHSGVPFSLTEEFVTVYRMHPLIPDRYAFVDSATGEVRELGFDDISGRKTQDVFREIGLANSLRSLGTAHPGAITLHNFPDALRHFERDGEIVDLAVVDVVRTRRRGVPRYNDFRAGLHMPRISRFEELTTDPETLAALQRLYPSVDDVDTVVGLLAETPPAGFGFSDTAFRVFLLMASRRLQSDRFLTVDFRPEVYTPLGMDWVARGSMADVVRRHCPELAGVVGTGKAAFAPWR
ncbi:Animal haem peroxidase [Geodermatophilus siccatus]|uniref:Animal haem peroxidase n=1 Tax=Geodermatophilus siccatus TaxID=1137991 RepID=A0A1G9PRZ9_9ACTN|nr:peroxidase family protein [Geodermatophilus siccatus]SDM01433.1 Animal haem peroxidase [Geodermatophilus siccatus]